MVCYLLPFILGLQGQKTNPEHVNLFIHMDIDVFNNESQDRMKNICIWKFHDFIICATSNKLPWKVGGCLGSELERRSDTFKQLLDMNWFTKIEHPPKGSIGVLLK